ncbi:SDR family oxidoreductase [Fulvivirgaceae bacterium BMA12]|uniref:SDR family oxidoreductase n=1 Tax=Agaribacillus aureus TaxID=3051825 RepID=A0ABT8L5F0_9BACT|nr:SDR family oxidoreductase [Fulvivirgaceae bacterium BMA12]
MKLDGKCCIITGAGDGIGRGIALAFADEGAAVAICDINSEALEATHGLVEKTGAKTFSKAIDIRDVNAITAFVRDAAHALGGVDVLVNNAAVMPGSRLEILTEETIDHVLAVNLKAPILFTRQVFPEMKKSGGGSIIHMSSVTGHNGFPEVAIYGATKGGLMALARGHAMELAPHNIRVNSVSPGTVDSPMLHRFVEENADDPALALREFDQIHPRGTIASIREIANVCVFLASDDSANITATDIRCDGGYCVQGVQPK